MGTWYTFVTQPIQSEKVIGIVSNHLAEVSLHENDTLEWESKSIRGTYFTGHYRGSDLGPFEIETIFTARGVPFAWVSDKGETANILLMPHKR